MRNSNCFIKNDKNRRSLQNTPVFDYRELLQETARISFPTIDFNTESRCRKRSFDQITPLPVYLKENWHCSRNKKGM